MCKFKNAVYGSTFPRDGEIPKKVQSKIESIIEIFLLLNPDGNADQIRELMCILYRRNKIDLR